jgi:hypothetical protein
LKTSIHKTKNKRMKKIAIILLFVLAACGGNKHESAAKRKPVAVQKDGLETFYFKVDGLQDSIVSDSIWKIIFQLQGVEKLVITKSDSSAAFTINPKNLNGEALAVEIEKRGGKVLN